MKENNFEIKIYENGELINNYKAEKFLVVAGNNDGVDTLGNGRAEDLLYLSACLDNFFV